MNKVRWVHNVSAFRSSHPSMVLTLSPLAGISFVFHVSKEEKEKQEAFASSPSSPKAETPSLTKSSQMSSFKAVLESSAHSVLESSARSVLESSARSERWLTFSRGIRKLKGDHEHNLTDLAIIIDMSSLTLVVITTVVSSAIYFHT